MNVLSDGVIWTIWEDLKVLQKSWIWEWMCDKTRSYFLMLYKTWILFPIWMKYCQNAHIIYYLYMYIRHVCLPVEKFWLQISACFGFLCRISLPFSVILIHACMVVLMQTKIYHWCECKCLFVLCDWLATSAWVNYGLQAPSYLQPYWRLAQDKWCVL